jgi:FlaG/FlaF family flagellin (archaellin)
MKTTTLKPKELKTSHKAVAPVIATLLMVAIAVVGGTIIFVFSQGFFSSSQISGTPQIEAVQILGYDARAVTNLQMHDGNDMIATSGALDPNVQSDDRVAIYVTNNSVQKIVLGEISFGGFEYSYVNVNAGATPGLGAFDTIIVGQLRTENYTVLTGTNGGDQLLNEGAGEIKAGQTVSLILDLESDLRIGRSSQFKLTTSNGNVFVGTISVGQQSG